MDMLAPFIGAFIGTLIAVFLPLVMSGSRAAEEKARARRIADARMNARLLRFNL
jgi:hypothetical protein